MLRFAGGKATFQGGIHPYEGKELSMDKAVRVLMPGPELVYPTRQHIGAPAVPLVKKGDRVLVGQKIADAGGFISACVICSVSGTVKAVEPRLTVGGSEVNCIIVENDGQYETVPDFGKERDWTKLSKEEIISIVKEAGIVGMGGAGFPTNVKLSPKDPSKIDTVIINGSECEPYLTSDYRMMLEETASIVGGLKIELSLFPGAKGIIAVEDNKPEAVKKLREAVKDEPDISVLEMKTKYPEGGERMLIYAATGRKINSALLPADAGVIVSNIDSAIAIWNAVSRSTPLIRRIITVTGDAIKDPCNFNVRTGTNYKELLEAAGGFSSEPAKIISGGPMMGKALFTVDVPVEKTSSALLCLTKDPAAQFEPTACIRCGRCVEACPEFLVPQKMMEVSQRHDHAAFEAMNGMECCECGSCTYVCPAKRRLTQAFKEMRKEVMDIRRSKAAKPAERK